MSCAEPAGLYRTRLLLSWRHTGFSIHTRVRVETEDGAAVERLTRYIMRPPISLERMEWDGVGEVQCRGKGGHDGAARQGDAPEGLDAAEYLARVLMHLPEARRHLVRYPGVVLERLEGQAEAAGGEWRRWATWCRARIYAERAGSVPRLARCAGAGPR